MNATVAKLLRLAYGDLDLVCAALVEATPGAIPPLEAVVNYILAHRSTHDLPVDHHAQPDERAL